jgi:hypothetical protein
MEMLVLNKKDFRNIFFRICPSLGQLFMDLMDRRFLYLERVMQMVVDCVFQGKNFFEINQSHINFDKQGSLLKVEDRQNYLVNFVKSFRSKVNFVITDKVFKKILNYLKIQDHPLNSFSTKQIRVNSFQTVV